MNSRNIIKLKVIVINTKGVAKYRILKCIKYHTEFGDSLF
jgi:hypothetical protein